MKRNLVTKALIAGAVFMSVPGLVLAQEKKPKENKDLQVITITRTGDKNEKTVVEITGDKVKVNGNDASDAKDVSVRVINRNGGGAFYVSPGEFSIHADGMSLFNEDPNRAMLGVVTEGKNNGASIVSVNKGSAAEKAGLKKGDVITKIGDKKIETTEDVTDAIRSHKPGDKVAITVSREGKTQTLNAELDKYKGISMAAVAAPRITTELNRLRELNAPHPAMPQGNYTYVFGGPRLGLSIQDTDDGKGVKVLDVEDDSNAAKAGLKEGDVITSVDGATVNAVDDLQKAIREKRTNPTPFKMQVLRDGKTQTVEVLYPRRLKTADL